MFKKTKQQNFQIITTIILVSLHLIMTQDICVLNDNGFNSLCSNQDIGYPITIKVFVCGNEITNNVELTYQIQHTESSLTEYYCVATRQQIRNTCFNSIETSCPIYPDNLNCYVLQGDANFCNTHNCTANADCFCRNMQIVTQEKCNDGKDLEILSSTPGLVLSSRQEIIRDELQVFVVSSAFNNDYYQAKLNIPSTVYLFIRTRFKTYTLVSSGPTITFLFDGELDNYQGQMTALLVTPNNVTVDTFLRRIGDFCKEPDCIFCDEAKKNWDCVSTSQKALYYTVFTLFIISLICTIPLGLFFTFFICKNLFILCANFIKRIKDKIKKIKDKKLEKQDEDIESRPSKKKQKNHNETVTDYDLQNQVKGGLGKMFKFATIFLIIGTVSAYPTDQEFIEITNDIGIYIAIIAAIKEIHKNKVEEFINSFKFNAFGLPSFDPLFSFIMLFPIYKEKIIKIVEKNRVGFGDAVNTAADKAMIKANLKKLSKTNYIKNNGLINTVKNNKLFLAIKKFAALYTLDFIINDIDDFSVYLNNFTWNFTFPHCYADSIILLIHRVQAINDFFISTCRSLQPKWVIKETRKLIIIRERKYRSCLSIMILLCGSCLTDTCNRSIIQPIQTTSCHLDLDGQLDCTGTFSTQITFSTYSETICLILTDTSTIPNSIIAVKQLTLVATAEATFGDFMYYTMIAGVAFTSNRICPGEAYCIDDAYCNSVEDGTIIPDEILTNIESQIYPSTYGCIKGFCPGGSCVIGSEQCLYTSYSSFPAGNNPYKIYKIENKFSTVLIKIDDIDYALYEEDSQYGNLRIQIDLTDQTCFTEDDNYWIQSLDGSENYIYRTASPTNFPMTGNIGDFQCRDENYVLDPSLTHFCLDAIDRCDIDECTGEINCILSPLLQILTTPYFRTPLENDNGMMFVTEGILHCNIFNNINAEMRISSDNLQYKKALDSCKFKIELINFSGCYDCVQCAIAQVRGLIPDECIVSVSSETLLINTLYAINGINNISFCSNHKTLDDTIYFTYLDISHEIHLKGELQIDENYEETSYPRSSSELPSWALTWWVVIALLIFCATLICCIIVSLCIRRRMQKSKKV